MLACLFLRGGGEVDDLFRCSDDRITYFLDADARGGVKFSAGALRLHNEQRILDGLVEGLA
jgi:hypothetical protein